MTSLTKTYRTYDLSPSSRPRTLYHFAVQGRGVFPDDMLRYDSCWPQDNEAVNYLRAPGTRTIALCSYKEPTRDRWTSFGWRLLP